MVIYMWHIKLVLGYIKKQLIFLSSSNYVLESVYCGIIFCTLVNSQFYKNSAIADCVPFLCLLGIPLNGMTLIGTDENSLDLSEITQ